MTRSTITRATTIAFSVCLLAAAPALAQGGEWQVRGRAGLLSLSGSSAPIADLGSVFTTDDGPFLETSVSYGLSRWLTGSLSVGGSFHTLTAERGVFADLAVGDVWLGSAALTLQIRPPLMGQWHPYLGLGVAYGRPFAFSLDDQAAAVGLEDLDFGGDLGWTVEAGVMYDLNQRWFLELSARGSSLTTEVDVTVDPALHYTTVDMDLDPWRVGLGVGCRF